MAHQKLVQAIFDGWTEQRCCTRRMRLYSIVYCIPSSKYSVTIWGFFGISEFAICLRVGISNQLNISAKSCISEYWTKGISWAGFASRCLASRWYSLLFNIHLTFSPWKRHGKCPPTFLQRQPNSFSSHSIYVKDNFYLIFSSKKVWYQKIILLDFISKFPIKYFLY